MKLTISKSKNSTSLYVTKSYIDENGKSTSKVVEKMGTLTSIQDELGDSVDAMAWARDYVKELTRKEKQDKKKILVSLSPASQIPIGKQQSYNVGYLFLQSIYHQLKLDKIANKINEKYKTEYNLDEILSRLIYSRILYPSSKRETHTCSKNFLEQPSFSLHDIYRSLDVISKHSEEIQAAVYKNSQAAQKRDATVLYYDCTNFYFETEEATGLKQYGKSKEHRPSPIVQLGLFMDGNGLPLAFDIHPGNQNEQTTLLPIEKRIIKDFELSEVIVCTDGGLSSHKNRLFNNKKARSFITTQSLKKLKEHIRDWALSKEDWRLTDSSELVNLDDVTDPSLTYYKERWINENGLEQRLVVSYSLKYKEYQQKIRARQIDRTTLIAAKNKKPTNNLNSPTRFLNEIHYTQDGEVADSSLMQVDQSIIAKEEMYDGFYAVCTNLEISISEILAVNKRRWEIEESFRIMKTELKARPVYLSRDDRIKAHFTICFLSLLICRMLEKQTENKYSLNSLIGTLKNMNCLSIKGDGHIPTYTRSDITDSLHSIYGLRTDYQIMDSRHIKEIKKLSKRRKITIK